MFKEKRVLVVKIKRSYRRRITTITSTGSFAGGSNRQGRFGIESAAEGLPSPDRRSVCIFKQGSALAAYTVRETFRQSCGGVNERVWSVVGVLIGCVDRVC